MLSFVLAALVSPSGNDTSPNEVRRASAVRDVAFSNVSVHATYEVRKRPARAAPFHQSVQALNLTIDSESRVRLELVEETTGKDEPPSVRIPRTFVSTPDGTRCLHPKPQGEGLIGEIWTGRGLPWAAIPTEVLFLERYSPSTWLEHSVDLKIDASEAIDGRETVKLDWSDPNGLVRGSFWFAPGLDGTPLRYEIQSRFDAKSDWKPSRRIEWSRVKKVGDLWLPGKLKRVQYRNYPDGHSELDEEVLASFSDWQVNRPLPASTFELEFPDKTYVMVPEKAFFYIQGGINDPGIKRQVGQARALARPPVPDSGLQASLDEAVKNVHRIDEPAPFSLLPYLLGIVAVAALAAGTWSWRRGAKPAPRGMLP